jgi:hypothetical protein
METIKLTIENDGGSVTRTFAKSHKDTIAWYDEVLEMVEVNERK